MSLYVGIIMLLLMVAEHCMYAPVCCGCSLCFDMCASISVHCLMGWFCFPVVFLVPLAAHQNYLQLSSPFLKTVFKACWHRFFFHPLNFVV
jgi:hypothetical protein